MNANGMNWCRQDFRLAVYLRDGCACVWCGLGIEDDAKLTLDHLIPREAGGDNAADNLVTACHACNSRRRNRTITDFASAVAGYVNGGITAESIIAKIGELTARELKPFRSEAKAMIARRGSAARALALNPTTDSEG